MIIRVLRGLLWLASALVLVGFAVLTYRSWSSPHSLDPSEQILLDQAQKLARHQPIYAEPSATAPASPLPGLPLVLSLFVSAFGPQPWLPSALSLVALLLVTGLVAWIVQTETESITLGVTSGALLLAGFTLLAGHPGAAAPEMLMMVLVLAGCLTLRDIRDVWGAVFGACMFSAAFFVHAQGLWFAVAGFVHLASGNRRRLLAYTFAIGSLAGGGYLLLSYLLGPWFNFYVWIMPIQSLVFDASRLMGYFGNHLLGALGVLTLAALLSLALPAKPWSEPSGVWMCMVAGALGAGAVASQSTGFGAYALTPTIAVLALVGPISLERLLQHLSSWPESSRPACQSVLLLALALQFVSLLSRATPALLTGT